MFGPTYLSTADRIRLREINDELSNSRDFAEIDNLQAEQRAIQAKAKTLPECTFDECAELSKQLYDHVEKLMRIGKRTEAANFQNNINMVRNRMHAINMETAKRLAEEQSKRDKFDAKQESKDEPRKIKSKSGKFQGSWSLDVSEFD